MELLRHVLRSASTGWPSESRTIAKRWQGIIELKIDHGPGYRVYSIHQGNVLVVLLCGGDKSTQAKDILRAKQIAVESATEGI